MPSASPSAKNMPPKNSNTSFKSGCIPDLAFLAVQNLRARNSLLLDVINTNKPDCAQQRAIQIAVYKIDVAHLPCNLWCLKLFP
jgi:hypothetical protein